MNTNITRIKVLVLQNLVVTNETGINYKRNQNKSISDSQLGYNFSTKITSLSTRVVQGKYDKFFKSPVHGASASKIHYLSDFCIIGTGDCNNTLCGLLKLT